MILMHLVLAGVIVVAVHRNCFNFFFVRLLLFYRISDVLIKIAPVRCLEMKLISSHIFYLLSGILVGVEWSVCSVAPTRQDYDDLDRSRRNTVSIGNNMVLMKYSECSKLSASCKALDDIDFVTCIFSKKRVIIKSPQSLSLHKRFSELFYI